MTAANKGTNEYVLFWILSKAGKCNIISNKIIFHARRHFCLISFSLLNLLLAAACSCILSLCLWRVYFELIHGFNCRNGLPAVSAIFPAATTPETSCPTLLESCVGSLTSHIELISKEGICETGPTVSSPYLRRLVNLTICGCHCKSSIFCISRTWEIYLFHVVALQATVEKEW